MNQDPMMQIFLEECMDLVAQYETYLSMAQEREGYDAELINEIFRITHTLKADATMMLFECIAVPAREFERLLHFYRNENGCQVRFSEFTELLSELIRYVGRQIDKIMNNEARESDGNELIERIRDYRHELKQKLFPELMEEAASTEEEAVRYYIASSSEGNVSEIVEDSRQILVYDDVEEAGSEDETQKKRRASVSHGEIEELYRVVERLNNLEHRILQRFQGRIEETADLLMDLHHATGALWDWISHIWTTPIGYISVKLHRIVEEMNRTLGKHVQLHIEGESVYIERSWQERISTAMIHLVRNAVDHGIESEEQRQHAGKDKYGNIYICYSRLEPEDLFEIRVSDDGYGMDISRILARARESGLVDKDSKPTEQELMKFIFYPGFSTSDGSSDYSGRGVGMDAVRYCIREIGGTISVISKQGEGTEFVIRIPYQDAAVEEGELEDEGIDSRR